MVEIKIKDKTINITVDKKGNTLIRDNVPISDEELKEFEEEILCKKISEASEEEINAAIQKMGKDLDKWVTKYKDAWLNWKKWAQNL